MPDAERGRNGGSQRLWASSHVNFEKAVVAVMAAAKKKVESRNCKTRTLSTDSDSTSSREETIGDRRKRGSTKGKKNELSSFLVRLLRKIECGQMAAGKSIGDMLISILLRSGASNETMRELMSNSL